MSDYITDSELFLQFSRSPKTFNMKVLKGAHRHLTMVLKGHDGGPKNSELIHIFDQFTKEKIKDYVYQRMKKSILLELALCIIQEIAAGGQARADSLQLEVTKTSSGGKQVVISGANNADKEFPVDPEDSEFMRDIDEALFTFKDLTASSPDRQIVSGSGCAPPYQSPDADGFFTPRKQMPPRSLNKEFAQVLA